MALNCWLNLQMDLFHSIYSGICVWITMTIIMVFVINELIIKRYNTMTNTELQMFQNIRMEVEVYKYYTMYKIKV